MIKKIGLDFDGVIHAYDHNWKGSEVIANEPVPGSIEFLRTLCCDSRFKVYILSARSSEPLFQVSLKRWLSKYGLEDQYIDKIEVVAEKPPLWIYIDDRAMCFKGIFPTANELNDFKAWDEISDSEIKNK